jgi:Co/Zn/Cd efflux system component
MFKMAIHDHSHNFEQRTKYVVFLTAITMLLEIFFGLRTYSMALLADGINMGSHVLAIGLSWIAYIFVRKVSGKELLGIGSDR